MDVETGMGERQFMNSGKPGNILNFNKTSKFQVFSPYFLLLLPISFLNLPYFSSPSYIFLFLHVILLLFMFFLVSYSVLFCVQEGGVKHPNWFGQVQVSSTGNVSNTEKCWTSPCFLGDQIYNKIVQLLLLRLSFYIEDKNFVKISSQLSEKQRKTV